MFYKHNVQKIKVLDLWEVFNRVQENIVEGNFQYLPQKVSLDKQDQLRILDKI
jgi:hypothetical protein